MYETEQKKERVILVGISLSDAEDVDQSLDELEELARTAGAECVGRVIQKRELIHPGTYVGKGKLDEIRDLLWETEADGIICDDELSPAQIGNLKDELHTKIMDRTLLILDIFAARASTNEGKIQVELAQLKYRQSRLTGYGTSLSRLGGGIGTRGPGEKKLEMDRRTDQRTNCQTEPGTYGSEESQTGGKRTAEEGDASGYCYCRLYQCGQVDASELFDGSGSAGRE